MHTELEQVVRDDINRPEANPARERKGFVKMFLICDVYHVLMHNRAFQYFNIELFTGIRDLASWFPFRLNAKNAQSMY